MVVSLCNIKGKKIPMRQRILANESVIIITIELFNHWYLVSLKIH